MCRVIRMQERRYEVSKPGFPRESLCFDSIDCYFSVVLGEWFGFAAFTVGGCRCAEQVSWSGYLLFERYLICCLMKETWFKASLDHSLPLLVFLYWTYFPFIRKMLVYEAMLSFSPFQLWGVSRNLFLHWSPLLPPSSGVMAILHFPQSNSVWRAPKLAGWKWHAA